MSRSSITSGVGLDALNGWLDLLNVSAWLTYPVGLAYFFALCLTSRFYLTVVIGVIV